MAMRCDLAGMLHNALACRSNKWLQYYEAGIDNLLDNLRELRDRHAAGDTGVVKEFFDLYVVDEGNAAQIAAEDAQVTAAKVLLNKLEVMPDVKPE